MRLGLIFLAAAVTSACSANVYKPEAAAVGSAATALGGTLAGYPRAIADAQRRRDDLALFQHVEMAGPLLYDLDCLQLPEEVRSSLNRAVPPRERWTDPAAWAEFDAAFVRLKDAEACGLRPLTYVFEHFPNLQLDTLDEADRPTPEEHEVIRAQLREASEMAARPSPDPTRPTPAGPSLEAFGGQLNAYGAALTAIATAQSTADVHKAVEEAGAGLSGLLTAAGEETVAQPFASLLTSLSGMAIEEMQRRALRDAVLAFEQAWPRIAPYLVRAARLQHADLTWAQALLARDTASTAQIALNRDYLLGQPWERLQLFEALNARVEAANSAMLTSARSDPAEAITAFTTTHAALARAVEDEGRLPASFLSSLQTLHARITALETALEKRDAQ